MTDFIIERFHEDRPTRKPYQRHGLCPKGKTSREYRAWSAMKQRCYNPKNQRFYRYGARGIQVCDAWLNDFPQFLKDMGTCPQGMTLERADNNGDYEPNNCRWATRTEQQRNKHVNRLITFRGKTQCLAAWAEDIGISAPALADRLAKHPNCLSYALRPAKPIVKRSRQPHYRKHRGTNDPTKTSVQRYTALHALLVDQE